MSELSLTLRCSDALLSNDAEIAAASVCWSNNSCRGKKREKLEKSKPFPKVSSSNEETVLLKVLFKQLINQDPLVAYCSRPHLRTLCLPGAYNLVNSYQLFCRPVTPGPAELSQTAPHPLEPAAALSAYVFVSLDL